MKQVSAPTAAFECNTASAISRSNGEEPQFFSGDLVQVTVLDHPMARRRIRHVAVGRSVGDIVRQFAGGRECAVTADGRRIAPVDRDRVMAMGSVQIVCVPGRGVGRFFRLIGALLAVLAAAFLAPVLAGALGLGAAATTLLKGVITTGLTLALSALFPAAQPQLESPDTTYSIGGGRNRTTPFGPIPMNLGQNRTAPPHAAQPWTEIVGEDQYLTVMVCWGYGPMTIGDMKIGQTAITEFEDVEIETLPGRATDAPPTRHRRSIPTRSSRNSTRSNWSRPHITSVPPPIMPTASPSTSRRRPASSGATEEAASSTIM